jgi:hypothetical protein
MFFVCSLRSGVTEERVTAPSFRLSRFFLGVGNPHDSGTIVPTHRCGAAKTHVTGIKNIFGTTLYFEEHAFQILFL